MKKTSTVQTPSSGGTSSSEGVFVFGSGSDHSNDNEDASTESAGAFSQQVTEQLQNLEELHAEGTISDDQYEGFKKIWVQIGEDKRAEPPASERSPIYRACVNGRTDEVKQRLEAGEALPPDSELALVEAARKGHCDMIRLMTGAKANVNGEGKRSPLLASIAANCVPAVKTLLELGARFEAGLSDPGLPLTLCATYGHSEIMQLLLEAGADPNVVRPATGYSPLHIAAQLGLMDAVRLLADNAATSLDMVTEVGTSGEDQSGHTAEELARLVGHEEVADWLMEAAMKRRYSAQGPETDQKGVVASDAERRRRAADLSELMEDLCYLRVLPRCLLTQPEFQIALEEMKAQGFPDAFHLHHRQNPQSLEAFFGQLLFELLRGPSVTSLEKEAAESERDDGSLEDAVAKARRDNLAPGEDWIAAQIDEAAAGDADSMMYVGGLYCLGDDDSAYRAMPEDQKVAVAWWRRAAVRGSACGQFAYGFSFCDGHQGAETDLFKALCWISMAAESRYDKAILKLAQMFSTGSIGVCPVFRAPEVASALYCLGSSLGGYECVKISRKLSCRGKPVLCIPCNTLSKLDGKAFRTCSRCKAVWYCSEECQKEHWREGGHRKQCKQIVAMIASPNPYTKKKYKNSDKGSVRPKNYKPPPPTKAQAKAQQRQRKVNKLWWDSGLGRLEAVRKALKKSGSAEWLVNGRVTRYGHRHEKPDDPSEKCAIRSIGMTPLGGAVSQMQQAVVELLLKAKADPNIVMKGSTAVHGTTALVSACLKPVPGIVRALLEAKADPNQAEVSATRAGWRPLVALCCLSSSDMARSKCNTADALEVATMLLKAKADPNTLETVIADPNALETVITEGPSGIPTHERSLLLTLLATHRGNEHAVGLARLLLAAKADPDPISDPGLCALGLAVGMGSCAMAETLLEAKAKVDLEMRITKKGHNSSGNFKPATTPLYLASEQGQLEAAALLLKAKASVNGAPGLNSLNPIFAAAGGGSAETVALLLSAKAELDKPEPSRLGSTPLHAAAERQNPEAVRVLVEAKAELDFWRDVDGAPLHLALAGWTGDRAGERGLRTVRYLLNAKAEVDLTDDIWEDSMMRSGRAALMRVQHLKD